MKKSILATVLFITTVTFSKAQGSFKQSDKLLSFGAGLGSPYLKNLKSSLPVNPTISWEKAIDDAISVGGVVSYGNSKSTFYTYNALYIGSRGCYHLTPAKEKLDFYIGGTLGYVLIGVSDKAGYEYGYAVGSGVGYSVFGGARYYFSKKAGLYGELGYGSFSILNAGVTVKI